jgi:hypothetical protein
MDQVIPNYADTLGGDALRNKVRRILTSTVLFVPAFIVTNFLLNILVGAFAMGLKYTARITYNSVSLTPFDWRHWNLKRVLVVQFAPPFLCLIAGLWLMGYLKDNTKTIGTPRLFVFWLSVCLVNLALSGLLFAPLGVGEEVPSLYRTFAIVGSWMHFDSAIASVFSIVGITGSFFWGMMARNELLRYSYSRKLISKPAGRNSVVLQFYLLPVIVGSLPILFLGNNNGALALMFMLGNLLLISIGMFIRNTASKSTVRSVRGDILNRTPFIEFTIALVIWVAVFRFFK